MLTIYLVRHGQDEDNANGILNGHRDLPLTELGVEQAHETADTIAALGLKFTAIYASPLQRAYRTAEIIAETLHAAKPAALPLLIERDFGIMTGQQQSKVVELCAPDILRAGPITYFLSPKGAETFPELLARARKLLAQLEAQHRNGQLLLVAHGDIGKMIYAAYYRLPWRDVLMQFHFGNSDLLELSPRSKPEEAHVHTVVQHNA